MKIAFIAIAIVLINTPAFAQYRQQGGGYDNVSCIRKQWRCADIPTAPTTHKHHADHADAPSTVHATTGR